MPDADDITNLNAQLNAHRRTLAILLRQLANLGADYAPPGVHNGIADARENIAHLKAALRAAGLAVDDHPDDLAPSDAETLPPDNAAARFARAYTGEVIRRLDHMELFGVPAMDDIARRQHLSAAYITLHSQPTSFKRSSKDDQLLSQQLMPHDYALPNPADAALPEWRGPVDQALALARRIVVQGEAGSGKSTLLQWLAVRSAAADFPAHLAGWNRTMPFYIRLRDHVGQRLPPLEDYPSLIAYTVAGGKPNDWVYQQLDSGRALILVDGVDELPQEQRAAMLDDLKRLVDQFPLSRYVISSRPAALKEWPDWAEWMRQAEFVEIALLPMTQSQIERFVAQWHGALAEVVPPEQRDELADLPANLLRLLRDRPALRRLADTPLLCAMLCALHRDRRQQLPIERTKLYEECVEMLLERRDQGRKVPLGPEYPNLSYTQKFALIRDLAYEMQSEATTSVAHDWVDNYFTGALQPLNLPADVTAKRIRAFFVERTGLLREPLEGQIDFTHRTFQEFLAARAAAHYRRIGTLLQHANDDLWRETIILAAGLTNLAESDRLLRGLIAGDPLARLRDIVTRNDTARQQYIGRVALALACLETAVELSASVRNDVLQRAAPLFPPKNTAEARLLAVAGEDIIPRLRADPQHSEDQAAACVAALAGISGDKALAAIIDYTADERHQVIAAIADAWSSFDRRTYARDVLAGMTHLVLNELDSLAGLELCANLTTLELLDTAVQDLTPLAQLSGLTSLTLYDTAVQDLTPLAQLTSLTTLNLRFTPVQDLTPLAQFTRLTKLYLMGTQVSDLSPLAGLTSLKHIDLERTQVSDLTPLAQLTSLISLNLFNTKVQDLTPLAQLAHLTRLYLSTNMRDTSVLKGLKNLKIIQRPDVAML